MLGWYDENRRVLPWRAAPGEIPDPYHVWLSEIMLQQTTVGAVMGYFSAFTQKWPRVADLAAARVEEVMQAWAGLGYYARARNLHKCAKIVTEEHGGIFPDTRDELMDLPGIGDYTSAAITAIAFDRPATVIDGNVERVMARIFAIETPLPDAKKDIRHYAHLLSDGRTDRPGDYAQALMDLGATICIPKAPRCPFCPVRAMCEGRKRGIEAALPARKARGDKPQRVGYAYIITDLQGRVLLERRPARGLLGGMAGFPTSEWLAVPPRDKKSRPPHAAIAETFAQGDLEVREDAAIHHVFTHFDLRLIPVRIKAGGNYGAPAAMWWQKADALLDDAGLPSLFAKIAKLMVHKS